MGVGVSGLPQLVTLYGYPVLLVVSLVAAAGAPVPLTSLLLALGALSGAHNGPDFTVLLLFGTLGSVAGDLVDYGAGRFGGVPLLAWLARHPRLRGGDLERARDYLERHGGLAIFFTRFILTAVASPLSVLVGASRMKSLAFLAWDTAGELLYILSTLLLGRLFGGDLVEDGAFGTALALVTILGVVIPLLAIALRWLQTARKRRALLLTQSPSPQLAHQERAGLDDLSASAAPATLPIR